jgi:cell division septation protein DedD
MPEKPEKPEKTDKPQKNIAASQPPAAGTPVPRPDFDFYHAGEENRAPARLEPPPKPLASKSKIKPATVPGQEPLVARANVPPFSAGESSPVPANASPYSVPDKATAAPAKNNRNSRAAQPLNTPQIPNGATVLQVAALVREADALALAQALQQKKFPAFVLTPGADHFYRVQVGPYADAQSATAARHGLENQGFKSIIKR